MALNSGVPFLVIVINIVVSASLAIG